MVNLESQSRNSSDAVAEETQAEGEVVETQLEVPKEDQDKVNHSTYGNGGRKTSKARVYIKSIPQADKGRPGSIIVNGRNYQQYFGRHVAQMVVRQPLELAELTQSVDVQAFVKGGGIFGQAQALRHGIANALLQRNEELNPLLRSKGYLTRDARKVERKKVGLRKARKAPQYSKR